MVERRSVAPDVAGSTPVSHPKFMKKLTQKQIEKRIVDAINKCHKDWVKRGIVKEKVLCP